MDPLSPRKHAHLALLTHTQHSISVFPGSGCFSLGLVQRLLIFLLRPHLDLDELQLLGPEDEGQFFVGLLALLLDELQEVL